MSKKIKFVEPTALHQIKNNDINPFTNTTVWSRVKGKEQVQTKVTKPTVAAKKSAPSTRVVKVVQRAKTATHVDTTPRRKIVNIKNLDVTFPTGKTSFKAVKNASLHINEKEIVGLVGESGSGKSTIGRSLMALNSFTNGEITVNGLKLHHNKDNLLRSEKTHLVKNIQYIFQNPAGALNPNKTIKKALEDVYRDNFKYNDYLTDRFMTVIKKELNDAFWSAIFKTKDLSSFKVKIDTSKKSHEEIINSDFYVKHNNIYIDFRNEKARLSNAQKSKELTDRQYLDALKALKSKLKKDINALETETGKALDKIGPQDVIKHDFKANIPTIERKIAKLIIKKKLTIKSLKALISKRYRENVTVPKFNLVKKVESETLVLELKTPEQLKDSAIKKAVESASLNWDLLNKKPETLSGGQQQRAVIARAIMVQPKIIVADEPISALDVSIQSQVINSIKSLRENNGISILFIAHDLHVVRNISDRIIVIYRGEIVEEGLSDEIFENAYHPYTRALLKAIPDIIDHSFSDKVSFDFSRSLDREWIQISDTHKVFALQSEIKTWKKVK